MSSTNIAVRFGKRLRSLRIKKSWSQVEMAEHLGVDRGHISDLEHGKKNVCLPMLEVLSDGFEMTIAELMKGV